MSNARQRRGRAPQGVAWSQSVALALGIGPDPSILPGDPRYLADADLAAAWRLHHRKVLVYMAPAKTWGFWAFSPMVPTDLRGGRPLLVPEEDEPAWLAEQADLHQRREQWLATQDPSLTTPPPSA